MPGSSPPDSAPSAGRTETTAGLAMVVAAGLIWGTIPLFVRLVDAPSLVKVFGRVFFASLVLAAYVAATDGFGEVKRLSWAKKRAILFQGVLLSVNWALFLGALDMTDVAVAELLAYTGPVFVAALAPFVTAERFDRRIVLPLLSSFAGIAVILGPHFSSFTPGGRSMTGALLAFASAGTFAMLMLRAKKLLAGISTSVLLLGEYVTASVLLAPVVFFLPFPKTTTGWAALITLGVFQTAFAVMLFLWGLRRVRTDRAAVLAYAEPVSAVFFAALFLGEPLTLPTIAGGAAVVLGGIMVARLRPGESVEPLEAGVGSG